MKGVQEGYAETGGAQHFDNADVEEDGVHAAPPLHASVVHHPTHGHAAHGQIEAAHLFREDKEGHVIERVLIPRPTNDPKDPLTWATWRKHLAFTSVSYFVLLSNYSLSAATPALVGIMEDFNISADQGSYLVTFQILLLGIGNLFWIPLGLKIGKRPVLIASSCIFFVSCIWAAVAKSYGSLLGARIIAGFGASASEAMGPAVVADLYFLHERGEKTAFYTLMIGGGSALGGIFGGLVVNADNNWRWIFWMCSILNGTCFLMIVLFQQETNFRRPAETETGLDEDDGPTEVITPKYRFRHAFNIFGWYDRETSLWTYFYRPLVLLLYPAVFFAAVTYGVTLGWVVFQLTANGSYFPALYNFSPLAVGNLYIANLVGAILGCLYSGPGSDWFVAFVTKRKRGYFRPEYRLWLMIVPFFMGPLGLLMWGLGLAHRTHWAVPAVGSGISYGVLCSVPNIGMTYVIDSYRPVSGEAMTSLTAFKNTFAFGLSFAVIPWIVNGGFPQVAGIQTLIEGVFFLTTIPLFIYGERLRRWTNKYEI